MDKYRNVYLEAGSFRSMVMSAIEVYNRETNGCLIGRNAVRNIYGKNVHVFSIKNVYPFLTDRRKPSQVVHGNVAAFRRVLDSLSSFKAGSIAGYHSHPYPYKGIKLSKSDITFIKDELKTMRERGHKIEDSWLELLVCIKRKDYSRPHKKGWSVSDHPKKIWSLVRTDSNTGYEIIISAFWVHFREKNKKAVIKEVPVHVPWLL